MNEGRTAAYAEALFLVARAEGEPGEVGDELFLFARALEGSDELQERLADPQLPAATRQQIIEDILGGRARPATVALASMVVGTGQARSLPAVVDAMVALSAREANKEIAEVRSAIPLSDDQRSRLAEALGQATGKQVEVKVIVDPSVRGGLVAQVGDTVIDGSVRRRLDQLRNTL